MNGSSGQERWHEWRCLTEDVKGEYALASVADFLDA